MPRLLLPSSLGRLPVMDVALAAALCIFAVGGLVSGQVQDYPLTITIPIAVVSTLSLAVRTRFPLLVAGVVAALLVAQYLFTGSSSDTLWALVVTLVTAYTVAAECEEGYALVGLGLILGGALLDEWLERGSDYAFVVLVFGGVWLFGRGTRSWRDQANFAEQHQHDLARIAVAEERTRIARELHDVVAHSLSVIAVQADAAEAALAKDPDRAGPPMRAIRASAREALVDMRQLLHVLRAELTEEVGTATEDLPDLTPARDVNDLPHLVAGMRESGLPVDADIRPGRGLSSGLELAVFRIAQEGLTNVRKHAGDVPTRLLVTTDEEELRIEVHNDAPSASAVPKTALSTGHGLLGARERVQAAGGTLEVGPNNSGGFDLIARLPLAPTTDAHQP